MKIKNTQQKILNVIFLCFLIPFLSFSNQEDKPDFRIKTIVIDAGHGGEDGATRGAIAREKDVALQVALKLGKKIESEMKDVKVIYTRKTDVFVKLYERIAVANDNNADLFISIHCNSMPRRAGNERVSGTETFVSGFHRLGEQDVAMRENASMLLEENYEQNYDFDPNDPESYIIFSLMKNQFRDQSIKLATLVQDHYATSGRINRGVKEQGLAVLARAGMPAILTEIGFISNPAEERYMTSAAGQAEIVENLTNAIKSYKSLIER
ncbi:N-acetylmuramoyl-L-alanine amidase family protein [Albibacterium bauzanense]|uniref:N-acetylmuramoyl-L-alanine amidase n=1 Tax=Albibacterium bauzanense TaxID=653929 RepID=A0A4R1M0Z9_9SPHI|nr:N-acetylmuramoyl-L-alanine amidase [Albibacterium bauzanense]TCK84977.1 N-acetylmuramoyl-L-alanine amidase [Albibacterium bauzanense]